MIVAPASPMPAFSQLGFWTAMRATVSDRASEIYQWLIDGDERSCRELVSRLRQREGCSILSICHTLTDVFHAVGDAWACSAITVYREHVASQIGHRLLMDLRSSLAPIPRDAPKAIGCAPESDPYLMPTLMVELVLQEMGWDAQSIGSDLPLELMAPAIADEKPTVCWVSVSHVESVPRLREQLEFLGDVACNHGVRVLCGGQAITQDVRNGIRNISFVRSLDELNSLASD